MATAPLDAQDAEASQKLEPALLDRDTLGHWARKSIESNQLLDYQAKNNFDSLDGCPGMRTAMRDHGDIIWLALAKARVRRVAAQTEALTIGIALGMVLLFVYELLLKQFGIR